MENRIVRLEDELWRIRTSDFGELPVSEHKELEEYLTEINLLLRRWCSEDGAGRRYFPGTQRLMRHGRSAPPSLGPLMGARRRQTAQNGPPASLSTRHAPIEARLSQHARRRVKAAGLLVELRSIDDSFVWRRPGPARST